MRKLTSLALRTCEGHLEILDQTLLPHEEKWIGCRTPEEMVREIQRLAIRGAPLIGVAAALSLAQWIESGASPEQVRQAALRLREARPTAVNLMAAIDRMMTCFERQGHCVEEAERIFDEDVALCEGLAEQGAALIEDGDSILTHCNSGGLATAGIGTALGVIRRAHEQGKQIHVYVDETRPLLQGARLTAWELSRLRIPHTLVCDNMAGFLMSRGRQGRRIQRIFVGADRIARNGDFANKIGTYSLAVLAHHHRIPFYAVAPSTTVDLSCPTGYAIPIEERPASEVRGKSAPSAVEVYNPAFDVTPFELISGIILENGMMKPE